MHSRGASTLIRATPSRTSDCGIRARLLHMVFSMLTEKVEALQSYGTIASQLIKSTNLHMDCSIRTTFWLCMLGCFMPRLQRNLSYRCARSYSQRRKPQRLYVKLTIAQSCMVPNVESAFENHPQEFWGALGKLRTTAPITSRETWDLQRARTWRR